MTEKALPSRPTSCSLIFFIFLSMSELGLILAIPIAAPTVGVPRSIVDGRRSNSSQELNKLQSLLRVTTNVPAIHASRSSVLFVVVDRYNSAVLSLDVPVRRGLVIVCARISKEVHKLVVGRSDVTNKARAVDVDVVSVNLDHANSISLSKGQGKLRSAQCSESCHRSG